MTHISVYLEYKTNEHNVLICPAEILLGLLLPLQLQLYRAEISSNRCTAFVVLHAHRSSRAKKSEPITTNCKRSTSHPI